MTTPLLEITDLQKKFPIKKSWLQPQSYVHAVDGVSLTVREGETVGIVGESGCGKSTFGRCVLRLLEPTGGEVKFQGENYLKLPRRAMHSIRRNMQMVFQNPYDTLNPKLSISRILAEPLIAHGIPRDQHRQMMEEIIEIVGLTPAHLARYPHEFSGGQRQRIGIARALMLKPKLIVADEPVSALDVSIQSQILNLLTELQEKFSLSYLFISHDLSVVEHISDRVAVMYLGEIVELADKNSLFADPKHPYTQALLSSVLSTDPDASRERIRLTGELPSPANPPKGCKFHTRCHACMEICKTEKPALKKLEDGTMTACHLY
ncbi:ABC transporter ATP-binding protein [Paenibacillus senegalensis]|uniref:ABC transporter ATP-binding protein n=1 Tax=Paenibacillus senegalensis TaxID=1465766 RepID=UPI0002885B6D|nr:dipeptide ABC transporter ATP-binding protein [Paenibacillus senegalensis]